MGTQWQGGLITRCRKGWQLGPENMQEWAMALPAAGSSRKLFPVECKPPDVAVVGSPQCL